MKLDNEDIKLLELAKLAWSKYNKQRFEGFAEGHIFDSLQQEIDYHFYMILSGNVNWFIEHNSLNGILENEVKIPLQIENIEYKLDELEKYCLLKIEQSFYISKINRLLQIE